METIIEKLKKIKALSERGIEGEKDAATFQLKKLMSKYNVTFSQLEENEIERRAIKYKNVNERIIICQIIGSVLNTSEINIYASKKGRRILFESTEIEFLEILNQVDFYLSVFRREQKKETDIFIKAFFYKHDIFPLVKSNHQPKSELSRAEILDLISAVDRLENIAYRKQLAF